MTKPNEPEGLDHEDRLIAALDDVERAFKTKGVMGRTVAIMAMRRHFPAHPVEDAGGVTEDDVIGLINIVTDLAEVDALDKAYPEVWGRLDAMVNHAVAAATAAKDAEIDQYEKELSHAEYCIEHYKGRGERLREALTYFANRPTVAEVIEGKHDPMPDTVEARIEEMGRRKREHDEAILQARAALSEAREAGDSLAAGDRV